MDSNNMTGEPNQQNPTSVFGFDAYPPPFTINWNQTNPFTNLPQYNEGINQQPLFTQDAGHFYQPTANIPSTPNIINPVSSQVNFNQQATGFSFGSPKPHPEVVHFGIPKPQQEVVNFHFKTCSGFGPRELRMYSTCKRKTDSPLLQPTKQHITEEKMAEHMAKLHISSETAPTKESDSTRIQRLYMCEEMRKLQTDSILPQSLLSQIQRPCTALVLWKPPTKLIPVLTNKYENDDKNNKSDDATNEDEMGDVPLNDMDLDTC